MGCGASAPAAAPERGAAPTSNSNEAPGKLTRMTKADSKSSAEKERAARLALAHAIKRQCGYVPIFHIKSEFDTYDVDRSGFLEVNELVAMLADLREKVDIDVAKPEPKDGAAAVDFDTFTNWYITVLTPHKVATLFNSYDEDKNGSITPEEVPALLRDLSEDSDEDACANAMSAMDANDDGRVTLEEFQKYFLQVWAKLQLAESFERCGVDVDKEVEKGELKQTLQRMGAVHDDAAINFMWDRLDTEETGKLTWRQFIDYASYNTT